MLHVFLDSYSVENVVNGRIRSFLTARGFTDLVVSRDLKSDQTPGTLVWSRLISPGVEIHEGFQRETFQISVSCSDPLDPSLPSGRETASRICSLLRAWFNSEDFIALPITNSESLSGPYYTNEMDGFKRPSYTFTLSVFQMTEKIV
jgi:hypothetical protein